MLREYKTTLGEEEFNIIYDDNINIIKTKEKYEDISKNELKQYRECHNRNKKLTIEEYNTNIDVVIAIYKELITERGLEKIIKTFPKKKNNLINKNKVMPICRCMNSIPLLDTKCGYICNELRIKAIGNRSLEIEYVEQKFMF